jgi:hypothetical protein
VRSSSQRLSFRWACRKACSGYEGVLRPIAPGYTAQDLGLPLQVGESLQVGSGSTGVAEEATRRPAETVDRKGLLGAKMVVQDEQ